MNTGKYVFAQMMEYLPRYEFDKYVKKYNGNFHSRELSCYCQLLHLLFGQFTACKSLRDICLCLKAHKRSLYHLGIGNYVNPSSLSRANERRDYRIFESLGYELIRVVKPLYADANIPNVEIDAEVFALDSTVISVSIKLIAWAFGKYSRGAVKMSTLLSLRGGIPVDIKVTHGKWNDSNMLDEIEYIEYAIYVMDRAYLDLKALNAIDKAHAFFLTRAKSNTRYNVEEYLRIPEGSIDIKQDCSIVLTGRKSHSLYPKKLRMVTSFDSQKGEDIVFITNNFDLPAQQIADIYRNRWQIETFFKWIKQNLTIKTLWGHSENAVKTHLWVAICAYLLVARIKVDTKTPYSITEVATILGVSAFDKTQIRELLKPDYPLFQNKNFNELSLFDDL